MAVMNTSLTLTQCKHCKLQQWLLWLWWSWCHFLHCTSLWYVCGTWVWLQSSHMNKMDSFKYVVILATMWALLCLHILSIEFDPAPAPTFTVNSTQPRPPFPLPCEFDPAPTSLVVNSIQPWPPLPLCSINKWFFQGHFLTLVVHVNTFFDTNTTQCYTKQHYKNIYISIIT